MPIKATRTDRQMSLQMPNDDVIPLSTSRIYKSLFAPNMQKVNPPVYCHKHGLLFTDNSLEWLKKILDESIDLVFEMPTTCNGMLEKTEHPTQKPEELLRKILLASSNKSDLILDPFSGSGTTLVAAEQLGRRWIGCDANQKYNDLAIGRLNNVIRRSKKEWIEMA